MPQWPGFIGGSYQPLSYRADRERSVNLYSESVESKHGPNTAYLRRRPGLVNFAGLVTEAGITSSVNYLLAGGGAGAGNVGVLPGGGGAGALLQGSVALTVAAYPVVIGAAGAVGANGNSTTWHSLTATGGGHGGNDDATPANGGAAGASGGGAATSYFDGSTWTPFTGGIGSQGFNGGNSDLNAGAGGGGAGGAGQSATQNNGGAGGVGVSSSISGSAVTYCAGGAGVGLTTRGTVPTGSYGSGGSSSSLDPSHNPVGDQVAAQGGVAIFSYRTGTYTAAGGTITTVGDYTVHTFTSDGTFDVTAVVATSSTTAGGGSIHYCPAQGRAFVISTSGTLYEIFTDGSLTNYGSVQVGAYRPTMEDNGTFNQLLIVSGYTVYVFDMSTNVLSTISAGVISNPVICRFSDGYFLLLNTSGVLQWSAPGDGTTWDALDIAKNSATADPWVSMLVVHRELWLLGAQNGQIWVDTGNTDQPFEMAPGSVMHQGVIAPFTLQRCDNSSFWVGQNDQGRCVVFRANGYTPTRVSTHAVELSLGASTDLENAIACTFQAQGHTFYQIYVPDLQTSWVYDVSTDLWFEWAQLVSDATDPWTWAPWPVQMATFAFGKNLVVGPETALVGQLAWDDTQITVTPAAFVYDHGTTTGGNGTTVTTSGVDTTTATFILLGISSSDGAATVFDSEGNTYTALTGQAASGPLAGCQLFYCVSPALTSASTTWTVNGLLPGITVFTFSGTQGVQLVGENGASSASTTTLSTGTVTPQSDGTLVVWMGCSDNQSVVDGGVLSDAPYDQGVGNSVYLPGQYYSWETFFYIQPTAAAVTHLLDYNANPPGALSAVIAAFDAQPITNLIEPAIRWVRRTPHGVNELKRVFYSRLDLLMDTGVGIGENPPIYLRYSNDGSQTWSAAKQARYGASGATTKRVYWTPLGSARDRIFEVYGDSMSPIRIVDAYIELTPGVS